MYLNNLEQLINKFNNFCLILYSESLFKMDKTFLTYRILYNRYIELLNELKKSDSILGYRERLLVAYYRYSGESSSSSNFDEVCQLLRFGLVSKGLVWFGF